MPSPRNVLICGGCGFMGSHFVRHLYREYPQYRITNFDSLTYAGNLDNLSEIEAVEQNLPQDKKRYTFVKADICDQGALDALFSKNTFDVVMNFAAESHVDRSILDFFQFIRTNVHGAYVLLEAARVHKIARYIYISTDEIYGDIPPGTMPSEDYFFRPTNPYAASKASADLLAQSYIKTHKTPVVIIRSSNNYGSHQYPEKLHPLVITNLLEDRPIPLHGEGQHIRSWLHVEDFCDAVDTIMHHADNYTTYNIAGEERTNLEVVQTITTILGKDPMKYVKYVNDRPGPDYRYALDDTKLRTELHWQRQHRYEEAVRELVAWYQGNASWWLKVRAKPEFQDHYSIQSKGYPLSDEAAYASGRF